jgi:AraC-like DNA-binding protein
LAAILHGHFMSVYYLTGPLMFFYVRGLIKDDHRLSLNDWWHFIPFALLTIGLFPYLFTSFDFKIELAKKVLQDGRTLFQNFNVLVPQNVAIFCRWIFYLIYFVYSLTYYLKHNKVIANKPIVSEKYKARLDSWVYVLLGTTIVITIIILWLTFYGYYSRDFSATVKGSSLFLYIVAIAYIILNFSLFVYPEILYGYPHLHSSIIQATSTLPTKESLQPHYLSKEIQVGEEMVVEGNTILESDPEEELTPSSKLKLLTDEYIRQMEKQIAYAVFQEIYLQKEFSILSLSEFTNLPTHHLSYYFNSILHVKFSDWRNQKRILHAQELISSGRLESMTILAVSEECGYSSQATFITAFKKETGLTPSNFWKNQK